MFANVFIPILLALNFPGAFSSEAEPSPICKVRESDFDNDTSVGCIAKSLIDDKLTYLVEFQHNSSANDPSVCWKTCHLIYPNTSVALISWNDGLDCYCGLVDSVKSVNLGPDVFCDHTCNGSTVKCGGDHTFNNGTNDQYYSVYCLVWDVIKDEDVMDRKDDESTTYFSSLGHLGDDSDRGENETVADRETVQETLHDIWTALMRSNIIAIVMIGLLVLVIILILILLVWMYYFIENHETVRDGSSLFYRRLSRKGAPLSGQPADGGNGYGATNAAFDPMPETEAPGLNDPKNLAVTQSVVGPDPNVTRAGKSTFFGGSTSSQESLETEPADER